MVRNNSIELAMVIGMCLFGVQLGCDSDVVGDGETTSVSHVTRAIEESAEAELDEGELPDPILLLEWIEVVGHSERNALDTLTLKVTNPKSFDVIVQARVECTGLINRKASMPLVPNVQRIHPGEVAFYSVKANMLPLQSMEGASELVARVTVKDGRPSQGQPRTWETWTAPFYYRHDENFGTVTTFNETVLLNKYGGVRAGSRSKRDGANIVGRILGANDAFESIRERDVSVQVRDAQGRVHGTIDGSFIEIGIDGASSGAESPGENGNVTFDPDPVDPEGGVL